MTRDGRPSAPPSFTPAAPPRRPADGGDGEAIVVGTDAPASRPARPTPSTPSAGAPSTPPRGTPSAGRPSSAPRPASFSPASGGSRPADGAPAIPVGGARPAPATRPAPARPRAATPVGGTAAAGGTRPAGAATPRSTTSRAGAAARPAAAPGARPGGPGGGRPAPVGGGDTPAAPRRRRGRLVALTAVLVLVALLAWPIGLAYWANGKIQHTPALSGAAGTPGTTYLLTGSDSRADGGIAADGTEGARTDTILLLHVPQDGPAALISLPRDTYVEIPEHGASKLNAAFAWGQAPLLVRTVEGLTGLTVDHYAEIGMAGVGHVVDAVGGVNLCYDADVNDPDSGMVWTAGCHDVGGTEALAFARMRKADPKGDVGRAERQRQLVSAVMGKVEPSSLVWQPSQQVKLVDAGTGALTVDDGTGIVDMARLALAFRAATGPEGITGTPPIADMNYRPGDVGSTVLLDPDQAPAFFAAIRDGSLPPGVVGGVPTS